MNFLFVPAKQTLCICAFVFVLPMLLLYNWVVKSTFDSYTSEQACKLASWKKT